MGDAARCKGLRPSLHVYMPKVSNLSCGSLISSVYLYMNTWAWTSRCICLTPHAQ